MTNNPTIDGVSREFEREQRYVVFKVSDIKKLSQANADAAMGAIGQAEMRLEHEGIPERSYLVIESDWPEYEQTWRMIEARVTGAAPVVERQAAEIAGLKAGIKLPERKHYDNKTSTRDYVMNSGWNACLDATAALNGEQK